MPRITICSETSSGFHALARALRDVPDVQLNDAPQGPSDALDDLADGDVLAVSRGLPPREILTLLGRVWSSHHPPRVLFLAPLPDEPCDLDPESAEELRERIGELARGESPMAEIRARFVRPLRALPTPALGEAASLV